MQSGYLADSSHTGYKPNICIDVSSEHTLINYSSRKNRFNFENDLTTTVAASENSDGFPQRSAASGSQQPAPANVVTPWLSSDMWSRTRKLVRSIESIASVEEYFVSRGNRDRDLDSVQTLSEKQNLQNRKFGNALYETARELEAQRLELYQANQWADQARREKINLCGALEMRNRCFQESRARTRQAIEELRRICCEETQRARRLRIDELSMQQERNPTTVSQLLTWMQDSQNRVNSLSDAGEFHDPETASSSGLSHVPSQPMSIPSPGGMASRDSCLPHDTRNSMGTSGNVFESLPAQKKAVLSFLREAKELCIIFWRIWTRENAISGKRQDSVRKETPPVSTTGPIVGKKTQ